MKRFIFIVTTSWFLHFLFTSSPLSAQIIGQWEVVFQGDTTSLTEIDCYDSLHCLVSGKQGFDGMIWSTIDGGRTWRETFRDISFRERGAAQYTTVTYFSPDYAIVSMSDIIDSNGFVMKSYDGGQSWATTQIHHQKGFFPFSMYDTMYGGGITSPRLLWTTDDGWQTWDSIPLSSPPGWEAGWVHDMLALGPERFLCVWRGPAEFSNTLALTVNNGATWQYFPTAIENDVFIEQLSFIDSLQGWAVGHKRLRAVRFKAYIFHTTDGGRSWETQFEGILADSASMSDVEFIDSRNGLAVSNQAVLRTTDGGDTWKQEEYEKNTVSAIGRVAVDYTPGNPGLVISALSPVILRYQENVSSVSTDRSSSKKSTVTIYPHPLVNGTEFTLSFLLNEPKEITAVLTDLFGRKVARNTLGRRSEGENTLELSVPDISAGTYFFALLDKAGNIIGHQKVIVN